MNHQNLHKLIEALEAITPDSPCGFNMEYGWEEIGSGRGLREIFHVGPHCNSVGCIGGWCRFLLGKSGLGPAEAAQEFLELACIPAHDLCYPSAIHNWFSIPLSAALNVLRHLDETGVVDWSPEVSGYREEEEKE